MKKILLIMCLLIYIAFISNIKKVKSEIVIPKEAIRLRVIANSNSKYDQNIKLQLTLELQKQIQNLLKDTTNFEEAKNIIKQNVGTLNSYVNKYLEENNYNQKYTVMYGNNYFPSKLYNGILYEKGYYESLVITLGKGEGKNWWCVLFPPLCLMETETDNNEYKFFVKEIIDRYF